MNRKIKNVLWGLLFIAVGVIVTMKFLEIGPDFDVFFKGWWTLFIIVPGVIDLFTEKNKFGSVVLILIGVGLLFAARDVITYGILFKLTIPAILVLIGIYMIYRTFVQKPIPAPTENTSTHSNESKTTGEPAREYTSVFSGDELNFNGQVFDGTKLIAVFGGSECDLRGAIITRNVTIEAVAIFGGVDIQLPPNVRLHIENSAAFLGGIDNHFHPSSDPASPIVTVRPTAIFGGVEIK